MISLKDTRASSPARAPATTTTTPLGRSFEESTAATSRGHREDLRRRGTADAHRPDARTNELLDRLIEEAHLEISHARKTDFTASQALFGRYGELPFVDSTTAAYMNRERIDDRYSFDDDFDALDCVTRLDIPDTPL